jgi:hypothetical protein
VLAGAENFETPGLFQRFLSQLLGLVSRAVLSGALPGGPASALADTFRELAADAASSVGTYNLTPEMALEKFRAAFTQKSAAGRGT